MNRTIYVTIEWMLCRLKYIRRLRNSVVSAIIDELSKELEKAKKLGSVDIHAKCVSNRRGEVPSPDLTCVSNGLEDPTPTKELMFVHRS